MASFANWYVGLIKKYPMRANMGSAFVLMAVGDVAAQTIESNTVGDGEGAPSRKSHSLQGPKVNFRRYGTLSPNIDKIHAEQYRRRLTVHRHEDEYNFGHPDYSVSLSQLIESIQLVSIDIWYQLKSIDTFRTSTMVAWSVLFYTPFFIVLYRVFDVFLPKQVTLFSVSARAGLSFLLSIPVNAAFFTYGCLVHHTAEWATLAHFEYQKSSAITTPFDMEMAWSTVRLKIEKELYNTVATSAYVWIPVNVVNFSVVPPHLRPLALMFCAMGWNCFLSLAQHRAEDID